MSDNAVKLATVGGKQALSILAPYEKLLLPQSAYLPFETFRDRMLDGRIGFPCGCMDGHDSPFSVDNFDGLAVDYSNDMEIAARRGRVFDVGDVTSADQAACTQAADLFTHGMTQHPFGEPYIISTVNNDERDFILMKPNPTTRYLNHDTGQVDTIHAEGGFFLCRFMLVRQEIAFTKNIVVSALFVPEPPRFVSMVSTWGYPVDSREANEMNTMCDVCATQVFLALALLANSSVERRAHGLSDEENKRRRRVNRPERFAYVSVHPVGDYKTLLPSLPQTPSEPRGGTHASPIMHERQGFWATRRKSGKRYWTRSTTVNPNNPGPRHRTHYEVAHNP